MNLAGIRGLMWLNGPIASLIFGLLRAIAGPKDRLYCNILQSSTTSSLQWIMKSGLHELLLISQVQCLLLMLIFTTKFRSCLTWYHLFMMLRCTNILAKSEEVGGESVTQFDFRIH